ncbi:MAG: hypothetical protein ACE5FG_11705 [Myxococcota bacterium]
MKPLSSRLIDFLERSSPRERALLLLAAMGLIILVWDNVFLRPTQSDRSVDRSERLALEEQLAELDARARTARLRLEIDPHAHLRERLAALESEIAAIDASLRERTEGVVTPGEMARVLEELLAHQKPLRLVRLEALPVEPLIESDEVSGGAADERAQIYRHAMEIELEGSFAETVAFLERVEQLPWSFFWDHLLYRVTEHPRARVTVIVHTFSTEEGWIGV